MTIDFGDVGRNEASTFAGFCAKHDTEIFLPIDTKTFADYDEECLFLLAYRAVVRELHSCMNGAIKIQQAYQKRVELGIDSGTEPGEAGMMAVERMIASHETYLYKEELDRKLINKDFSWLSHSVFKVVHDEPCFAAASFFDLHEFNEEDERVRVALNVFPTSRTESAVVFSYTAADRRQAQNHLRALVEASGDYQKYLLSKQILMLCENLVVSPAHFDTWSKTRIDSICKFFVETLRFDKDVENPDLYLF